MTALVKELVVARLDQLVHVAVRRKVGTALIHGHMVSLHKVADTY